RCPCLSILFPYTTLFRSPCICRGQRQHAVSSEIAVGSRRNPGGLVHFTSRGRYCFFGISRARNNPCKLGSNDLAFEVGKIDVCLDRKSTRLNSSHVSISY